MSGQTCKDCFELGQQLEQIGQQLEQTRLMISELEKDLECERNEARMLEEELAAREAEGREGRHDQC